MICKNCSAENEEGAKFCSNCGLSLSEIENTDTPAVQEIPEQIQEQQLNQVQEQPADPYQNPYNYQAVENQNPFGTPITDNSGSYSAAPQVPPVNPVPPVNQAPAMSAYPPSPVMPQVPPVYPYGINPLLDPFEGKAKAAKVCGILSIVLTCVSCGILWIAGAVLGVIGIVLGSKYQDKVFPLNRSKAKTGLVCGIIGVSICLVIFVLTLFINKFADSSAGQDFYRQFQEQFDTFIRPIIF